MKSPDGEAAAHWQRLRKDAASNVAGGGVIVSAVATVLSVLSVVLGSFRGHDRGDPLYWAILLPVAIWGTGISSFSLWAVRTMRPVALALPVACLVVVLVGARAGEGITLDVAALLVAAAGSAACLFFLPRSLLWREGPDRR